jgi:hypothetical protein
MSFAALTCEIRIVTSSGPPFFRHNDTPWARAAKRAPGKVRARKGNQPNLRGSDPQQQTRRWYCVVLPAP